MNVETKCRLINPIQKETHWQSFRFLDRFSSEAQLTASRT
jgi:hypothetical protein